MTITWSEKGKNLATGQTEGVSWPWIGEDTQVGDHQPEQAALVSGHGFTGCGKIPFS
ncbi:MAG: hypothetical protein WBW84_22460 [Acidobacteriaceae bacterium]